MRVKWQREWRRGLRLRKRKVRRITQGPENTEPEAAVKESDTQSNFHVTTWHRNPATKTALQAKQCFIHAKAVTRKC